MLLAIGDMCGVQRMTTLVDPEKAAVLSFLCLILCVFRAELKHGVGSLSFIFLLLFVAVLVR